MIQKEVGIHFVARHNLGKKLAFWDKALEYGIGSNRRFKPFLDGRGTFPTEQNQSLTSAYIGQQGRLFVFHYVDHQFHAKPEAGDEHIPF